MKDGWRVVKLGDVIDLRKEQISPSECRDMKFVGLEHLVSGQYSVSNYEINSDLRSSKNKFYPEDILYGKLRPYLDKGGIVNFEGYCSTDILVFIPKENVTVPEYIANIIHTKEFIDYSITHKKGTNHPRTSWSALSKYEFLLPPLSEQKRIAEILSAADAAIEEAGRAIALSEKEKKGLMQKLIPDMDDGLKDGWVLRSISDDVNLISGQHINSEDYSFDQNDGVAYLTGPDDFVSGSITPTKFTKKPKSMCQKGDVLITVKGSGTGKTIIADMDYCISRQLMALHTTNWDASYLYYTLSTKMRELNQRAVGLIPGITRNDILRLKLPIPSLSEQKRIAEILKAADEKIALCKERKAILEKTKQGLMQKLLGA